MKNRVVLILLFATSMAFAEEKKPNATHSCVMFEQTLQKSGELSEMKFGGILSGIAAVKVESFGHRFILVKTESNIENMVPAIEVLGQGVTDGESTYIMQEIKTENSKAIKGVEIAKNGDLFIKISVTGSKGANKDKVLENVDFDCTPINTTERPTI